MEKQEGLTEADTLRFQLLNERIHSAEMQLELAKMAHESHRLNVSLRYNLTEADRFDYANGQITRGERSPDEKTST